MGNENYLKMLKYGEWLEKLFSPDLQGEQMADLAEAAIVIYGLFLEGFEESSSNNVSPDFSTDDVFLSDFKRHKDKFRRLLEVPGGLIRDNSTPYNITLDVPPDITIIKYTGEQLEPLTELVIQYAKTFSHRNCTMRFMKYLSEFNEPWRIVLHPGFVSDAYPRKHPLRMDALFVLDSVYTWARDDYGKIRDGYRATRKGIEKVRVFDPSATYYYFKQEWEPFVKRSIFPWHIVITRMLLDFLALGGQDYYGFCKQCGRFFLVQRKGRKQYCSHICRTTASLIRAGKIKPK